MDIKLLIEKRNKGATWQALSRTFKGHSANSLRKAFYRNISKPAVKILILDIETAPIIGSFWQLYDQNIALNQIKSDWHLLSWAAKWLNDPIEKVMYADQRHAKNIENDKDLLQGIWNLIDEADIIIGQKSKSFDLKKLNAKFLEHGFPPPSSYRQIDTYEEAKKHFSFTSNKLEYMTKKFCKKYVKSTHSKFSGFELWKQCLAGNKEAWNELKKYNIFDVMSTEELYTVFRPWIKTINFDVYHDDLVNICSCGSKSFIEKKYVYTNTSKNARLICTKCGKEHVDKTNLLTTKKRKSLKK